MKKKRVSLTLSEDLLEEIDKQRGLIKRSTFIEQKLREAMATTKEGSRKIEQFAKA